jgi:hypothetical protein
MHANGGGTAAACVKSEAVDAAGGVQGSQPGCRRSLALRGPCYHCGTTISSQWRSGPPDKPVLCNACGLYYRKVQSLPDHTCQVAGALSVSSCAGQQQAAGVKEMQQQSSSLRKDCWCACHGAVSCAAAQLSAHVQGNRAAGAAEQP